EDTPAILVTVGAKDAPEEGARMSIVEGTGAAGNARVTDLVPDPAGAWVVERVYPSPEHAGYVSVYLENPSRPDLPDRP
ncbi:MAG: hypothetical protein M3O34_05710, partial [Chloroflexota bacterium]|nr:hypothetical protein [Chloroflexota bacterium]